jgi:hypothetical protein
LLPSSAYLPTAWPAEYELGCYSAEAPSNGSKNPGGGRARDESAAPTTAAATAQACAKSSSTPRYEDREVLGRKPLSTESLVFPLASGRTPLLSLSDKPSWRGPRKHSACGAGDHATTLKRKEDTASGCRELAAANLSLVLPSATLNEQHRFEHSAVMWLARADLLARLELQSKMAPAAKRGQLDKPFLLHSDEPSSCA